MLKVVLTRQVCLGMFIHELKGAWIDNPFWKKSFKLVDTADLKKLQACGVKEVIIDICKGLDVADLAAHIDLITVDAVKPVQNPSRTSAVEEHDRAKRIISASKVAVASMFHEVRMGKAISAEAAMELVDDIADSIARNESALISLVRLKNKDDYTYMHSVAVCALMVALAKGLSLTLEDIKSAGLAGLLHDIGKAAISMDVLNKPGALTEDEFALVKLHPERGHALLLEANISDEIVLDVCLHHHEKMSALGYPHQLKADDISSFARMAAVCDVYDAITSKRPYKDGWDPGVALHRMAQWTDHFDDRIFKAFVKSVGIYPIGSMVKLKSGRLAVVIDQNASSLLTPLVKVFFSTKTKSRIVIETVDLSAAGAQDSIVGHFDPALLGITDISKIWSQ